MALAPLLLLAVYLPGQLMLRCRIDGLLRPACCCSHDDRAGDSGPVAKAQDCCDQETVGTLRPVVDVARAAEPDLIPTVWTWMPVVVAGLTPPAPRADRAWAAHGPPDSGPPVVLVKHAFLI